MLKQIINPLRYRTLRTIPPSYLFGILKFNLPDLGEKIK